MGLIYKTYNVASGFLEFKFYYDDSLMSLSDFDILSFDGVNKGYDNENNLEISSFPDKINITIDAYEGNNYQTFRKLLESYNTSYPSNAENILTLYILLNGDERFKGILFDLNSNEYDIGNSNELELDLTFVDGINLLKDYSIANPAILQRLYQRGLVSRSQFTLSTTPPTLKPCYAYGFGFIGYNYVREGYYINNIETGEKETNLKKLIIELFKTLNNNLEIEFTNEFSFRDILTGSPEVLIDSVNIARIFSNLLGRYVVIAKNVESTNDIVYNNGQEYTKPQYFEKVYEDNFNVVYYHNFSGTAGTFGTLKYNAGIGERTIADFLKILAKQLFSYYGFKKNNKVFFRHRRYTSAAELIPETQIVSMTKLLSVDKIQGVKITDYYESNNVAIQGVDYDTDNIPQIAYKLPLHTYKTTNDYEYRLNYQSGGQTYKVVYVKDLQTGFEHFPNDVVAKAEWEAHRTYRDKYEIILHGVNYEFDKTYKVNYKNYVGTFRIITLKENYNTDTTTLTALEIDNV